MRIPRWNNTPVVPLYSRLFHDREGDPEVCDTEPMLARRVKASLQYRYKKTWRNHIPFAREGDSITMWQRQVMNSEVRSIVDRMKPSELDAIEVSGNWWGDVPWASYRNTEYPAFNLAEPPNDFDGWDSADVVLCEQVLEHVPDPVAGMRNLVHLARPGGTVIVSTPFLVRIHPSPNDYWRFAPDGLEILMTRCGLENVMVDSWGNRWCARSNFRRWTPARPWRSLRNEKYFPIQVWGVGTRPA